MSKILIVDDDVNLATLVADTLEASDYVVEMANDGLEGSERLRLYQYDLAILDINLPKMNGVEICRLYRERGGMIPILMLTGRAAIDERTEGLDSGADDYLTKPFAVPELLSRVRALLRRPRVMASEVLQYKNLSLDLRAAQLTVSGAGVKLLPKEFALLTFFMRNPQHVYSARDLLDAVWSSESDATEVAVGQCILRLRKKIDDAETTAGESKIRTIKGIGYRFGND